MENRMIVTLTVGELKAIINECISEVLLKNIEKPQDETLMKREDVAKYFSVSTATITDWANEGKLIKHSIGNRIFFKKNEVMNALVSSKKYNRR